MNTKTVNKVIELQKLKQTKHPKLCWGVFGYLQSVAFIREDDILQADVNSTPTTDSQRILTSIKLGKMSRIKAYDLHSESPSFL